MTQLRYHPGSISNYFDAILGGIGHRGSSFSDIDAVSHDGRTKRFLVQEFKREGEMRDKAQHWMLQDLAGIPKHFTVWVIEKRWDGMIGFAVVTCSRDPLAFYVISVEDYQDRFRAWWNNGEVRSVRGPSQIPPEARHELARPAGPPLAEPFMDTDLKW